MPATVQVVHRLHGEEDQKIGLRRFGGIGEAQIELAAARDDFHEQLVDLVLVGVGETGDRRAHLAAYVLEMRQANSTTWTSIASGKTSIVGAKLGAIDPTLFEPGTFALRLRAMDTWGNTASAEITITLKDTFPIGQNKFTVRDVKLQLLGIPEILIVGDRAAANVVVQGRDT